MISRIILDKQDKKPNVWIQISVPNEFQAVGDYNIGVTAGVETTIMPPECLEGINRMNKVLTSSQFSKDVMKASVYDKNDKESGKTVSKLELTTQVEVLYSEYGCISPSAFPHYSGVLPEHVLYSTACPAHERPRPIQRLEDGGGGAGTNPWFIWKRKSHKRYGFQNLSVSC